MLTEEAVTEPLALVDPSTVTQRPTTTAAPVAGSVLVKVVDAEAETSTFAGWLDVPTFDVPPEPTVLPMPFTVIPEPEIVATAPDAVAMEKLPPPNPPPAPPPNPPPAPPRLPPNPPAPPAALAALVAHGA